MSKEVLVQEVNPMMIIDGLKLDRVQDSMDKIQQFQKIVQGALVEGHDYGAAFPGSSKPSLLKPGAERILMLLGLASEYEIIEKIQNYEEGFFAYTVRCILTKCGQVVTEGLGHCNSKEKKYDSDKQDKYMLGNTCLKMAKKRAQVDAALTVGSLSNIFTQDLEDMVQFNQSEKMDTMTINEARNIKLTFGKHKGKTLEEVYKEAPDYVQWLLGNERTEPAIKKACEILVNGPKKETTSKSKERVDKETGEIHEDIPTEFMDNPFDGEDIPF